MAAAIIELNDHEVRIAQAGAIVARSPAAAIINGNNIEVGTAASDQAQLHPREFHNRFWYQLDQASLRRPTRVARHHADLAFKHLEQLHSEAGKPEAVVWAIPGGYGKEQLALLLGIAEACKIRTIALVDAAVASAAAEVGPGHYQHVEMQLHRAVITGLDVGTDVERGRIESVDGAGFDKLNARLVAFVADQFLAQSRFDPLHQASTEQLLYNELPNWLDLLGKQREIKVHIEFRRARFEARIARDDVIAVADPVYQDIRDRLQAHATCLVGSRLAGMPGFRDHRGNLTALSETSVFTGCEALAASTPTTEAGLSLITSLPASAAPAIVAHKDKPAGHEPSRLKPTHILIGPRAFPLSPAGLYLSADGTISDHANAHTIAHARLTSDGAVIASANSANVRLNGLPITESAFGAGDEVTVEGGTPMYFPICVTDPDAP